MHPAPGRGGDVTLLVRSHLSLGVIRRERRQPDAGRHPPRPIPSFTVLVRHRLAARAPTELRTPRAHERPSAGVHLPKVRVREENAPPVAALAYFFNRFRLRDTSAALCVGCGTPAVDVRAPPTHRLHRVPSFASLAVHHVNRDEARTDAVAPRGVVDDPGGVRVARRWFFGAVRCQRSKVRQRGFGVQHGLHASPAEEPVRGAGDELAARAVLGGSAWIDGDVRDVRPRSLRVDRLASRRGMRALPIGVHGAARAARDPPPAASRRPHRHRGSEHGLV